MALAVIDLHIDTLVCGLAPEQDLAAGVPGAMADLPRLAAAGVRAAVWAACDDVFLEGSGSTAHILRMLAVGRDLSERHPDMLRLVRNAQDLRACLTGGPMGMLLGLEGAHSLQGSLEIFTALAALGVRVLTLTWNQGNAFATGCQLTGADQGLSPLGAELLARAAQVGVIIDLAHASSQTIADALARLRQPPLVSHTACAALHSHPRNLDDAQLGSIGARAGLVGVTFCRGFLGPDPAAVGLREIAAHVRHALQVAGEEHVALGSDFDGIRALPRGLRGCQDWDRVWAALAEAGLTPAQIEAVAWRNAARFLLRALPGDPGEGGPGSEGGGR